MMNLFNTIITGLMSILVFGFVWMCIIVAFGFTFMTGMATIGILGLVIFMNWFQMREAIEDLKKEGR